jgi:hypothetical protein
MLIIAAATIITLAIGLVLGLITCVNHIVIESTKNTPREGVPLEGTYGKL